MPVAGALITRAWLTHFHPSSLRKREREFLVRFFSCCVSSVPALPTPAPPPPLFCLVSLPVPLPVRSICQRHVTAWAALNCVSKDFFSFLFSPLSPFVSPPPPPTLASSIARVCLFVYSACCLLPFSASFASGGRRQRRRRRGRQRDSLTDGPGKWGKPFCVFRLSTIFSYEG